MGRLLMLEICMFLYMGPNLGFSQEVHFIHKDTEIDVKMGDKLITTYRINDALLKPCLHPVNTPSGVAVTRGFPFEDIEGESRDHPHHTGVYFTYGSKGEVNGNSFWNLHDIPPQIKHVKVLETQQEKNRGTLTVLNHWIGTQNIPILEETRSMIFTASEGNYTIDFDIELTALETKVVFEDTKEGMFAIRVADWLAENSSGDLFKGSGEYLNADGEKNEKNIWGKRSNWVRLEGEKNGESVGVVIFHHPASTNFPTYWHARGYGCFAANPIGQYEFQKARDVESPEKRSLVLMPGQSAVFKFRMMIYDGRKEFPTLKEAFSHYEDVLQN
jgi:hypothetical protein